jgi:hypothetical protein
MVGRFRAKGRFSGHEGIVPFASFFPSITLTSACVISEDQLAPQREWYWLRMKME